MVLKKKYIHRNHEKGQAISQITLDDDFNISDNKPDVIKIIQQKGEIKIEEIKVNDGHIWVRGMLEFQVLYKSDQSGMRIACVSGSIPFQENLSLDAVTETDTVKVKTTIEDLSMGIINSRKLNIRALVDIMVKAEEIKDEAVAYGVEDDAEKVEKRIEQKDTLQLVMAKKDNCRFKNEIMLPSNKPNVSDLLWKNVQLRNIDTRLKNGNIDITGEALVFVVYNGAEEGEQLQWLENSVPLHGEVECNLKEEDLICQIVPETGLLNLEVKPDYDGEERMLNLDLVLDLDIHIWREEPIEILEDIYSLKKNLIPAYEESSLENLLIKNDTKCRVQERIAIPKEEGNMLQLCSCDGRAQVESTKITEQGVEADGTIEVNILFVTTEDVSPLGAFQSYIPFHQLIEVDNMNDNIRMDLNSGMEQLSAVMIDNGTVEIKAVVDLELMAFEQQRMSKIQDVDEQELDFSKLQEYPGITGYIVKEGDSIWDIAKENHTTIQNIVETNQLGNPELKVGEKILIVKDV